MNERSLEVLSQYDIIVEKTARGRGAYLVWTDKGFYELFEYSGTEGRLKYESELLNYIRETGFDRVDIIEKTNEGKLYSEDEMGVKYVLKKWYEGRECDVKKVSDIVAAVQTLACLHLSTECVRKEGLRQLAPEGQSLFDEYTKHNRELKRVRNFIRSRNRKSQFEYDVLAHFDEYYGYAEAACNKLDTSWCTEIEKNASDMCSICHGTYNYHNLIMEGNNIAVVNFNHSTKGLQIRDLYFFLRKIMEKHDWDVQLGCLILDKYQIVRPLKAEEMRLLYIMMSYPEKFWKVLNQYNNSNKSWIPDKNIEKLKAVYRQQELKTKFVEKLEIASLNYR